ncbi:hypothetical protein [Paenibacillus humicola]|uniref:hypothetical protein n=1 Tax=Paenibacillus humicola TaxID=3110540 RepID=UPI00237AFAC5|nr:hypothetical protein [Paenibacillus humicola]
MWKMTGWLAKAVAAGLIVSFLSIWTTGYIVNSYVETLLKQYNIPLETKPFALHGIWGDLWGADPQQKAKGTAASAQGSGGTSGGSRDDAGAGSGTADSGAAAGQSPDAGAGGTGSGEADGSSNQGPLAVDAFGDLPDGALTDIGGGSGTKANSGKTPDSGAAANNGTASGSGSADPANGGETPDSGAAADSGSVSDEASNDGLAMSTQDLNKAKSAMSDEDKQQLFDVMMSKLPPDAWQKISGWMEDGLTDDEMTQVQQLMAQYLDRDQYDKMMSILKKY